LHQDPKIHGELAKRCPDHLPTLFQFISYVFSHVGVLAGPAVEFKHYIDFQSRARFKNVCSSVSVHFEFCKVPDHNCPSTVLPSLKILCGSLLCFPLTLAARKVPLLGVTHTDGFYKRFSFLQRILYLWSGTALMRWKYYLAWLLSESGCIACGLGFDPTTSKWFGL